MMLYEVEREEIDINVPRTKRGVGTFAVLRIRNRSDLLALSELLDEPRLRSMKPNSTMNFQWHADKDVRDALGGLFCD